MKTEKYIVLIFIILLLFHTTTLAISSHKTKEYVNTIDTLFHTNLEYPRQPAEFEPMEAVLIRYPLGLPVELIAEMSKDVTVITIVQGGSQQAQAEALYQTYGVDLLNCSYLFAPSDTYWTRDYGPWFTFTTQGLSVVDFNYARGYRPNDNNISSVFAEVESLPLSTMPLSHEGGNYMTDGHGISMSTDLVYSINTEHTSSQIQNIIHDYLGVDTYHVVPDVNGEYIRHIDCWGKFLSPTTILIREVPSDHPQYDEIEDVVSYISEQQNCYNTSYDIVRVYTPNNEPYTNSLILNEKVFIPIVGSEWDDNALATYETVMPGYEIYGFPAVPSRPWYSTDALHCRTKGIPDRGMLYINHTPLFGVITIDEDIEITTEIIAYSKMPLLTNEIKVYWTLDMVEWNMQHLQHTYDNFYTTSITSLPLPVRGTKHTFQYYIHAEDTSGRKENHPYMGAPAAYSFSLNNAPQTPYVPNGPSTIKKQSDIFFSTHTTDINTDTLYYQWDWGDGHISDWVGPYKIDTFCSMNHSWSSAGNYNIKVRAKDEFQAESHWSDPFTIQVTKTKSLSSFFEAYKLQTITFIKELITIWQQC